MGRRNSVAPPLALNTSLALVTYPVIPQGLGVEALHKDKQLQRSPHFIPQ